MVHFRVAVAPLAFFLLAVGCAPRAQWYRGNTHTHSYWSDGDAAPEQIIAWYADNDYDFLVLSDHNILQDHEKWFPISESGGRPLRPEHVEALRERFGHDWVVTRRREDGSMEMLLKTLPPLQSEFNRAGEFLLIPGEEVTDRFETYEVHINAINVAEVIPPQHGASVRDTIQRNIDAILAHGHAHDRPVLAHVNHPNYVWSLTPADIAALKGERFFEVYNGHRSVGNEGDDEHPSTDAMWDEALALRLSGQTEGDAELLYAVATDDAHNHHDPGGHSIPGRGWVMVRAAALTEDALIAAMRRGDFYASSGVTLRDVRQDSRSYTVVIDAEPGVRYRTEFIGRGGAVLGTTEANPAIYHFTGSESYVRARVTSTKPHPRPYRDGDFEMAWAQPVRVW